MPSQFSTDWVVSGTLRTPTAYYDMQSGDKEHLRGTMVSSALPSTPKSANASSEVASRFLVFSKAVMANGHPRGRNGVVSPSLSPSPPHPSPTLPPRPPSPPNRPRAKTEGAHSSEQSSLTSSTERNQLVCPELAVNYSSSLIGNRGSQLSTRQRELERKLASLKKELGKKQLLVVHKHAQAQLESHAKRRDTSVSSRSCSMEASPLTPIPPVEVMQVDGAPANPLGLRGDCQRLDSTTTTVSSEGSGCYCDRATSHSVSSLLDESSSLDWSTELELRGKVEGQAATHVQKQLECLQGLVDEEMTEGSSDEEEGEETPQMGSESRWVAVGGRPGLVTRWVYNYTCVVVK